MLHNRGRAQRKNVSREERAVGTKTTFDLIYQDVLVLLHKFASFY